MHQALRTPEDLGALQKERALLGKEQREPFVHLDLVGVRLHLRKIRVVGGVEHQVGRDPHARVEPELGVRLAAVEHPIGARPIDRAGQFRLDLQ